MEKISSVGFLKTETFLFILVLVWKKSPVLNIKWSGRILYCVTEMQRNKLFAEMENTAVKILKYMQSLFCVDGRR